MDLTQLEWRPTPPNAHKLYWRDEDTNPYVYKVFAAVIESGAPAESPFHWIARVIDGTLPGTTGSIPCESLEDGMRQAETYVALTNYDCFLKGKKNEQVRHTKSRAGIA